MAESIWNTDGKSCDITRLRWGFTSFDLEWYLRYLLCPVMKRRRRLIMKLFLTGFCAFALLTGPMLTAQDKGTAAKSSSETQQTTKTITGSKTVKTTSDVVAGRVEKFQARKSMSVTIPGTVSSTKSFALNTKNETYNLPPSLKVGDWVTVRETTDNNGHKTMTVTRSKHVASRRMTS
jgi:hypothetical protein